MPGTPGANPNPPGTGGSTTKSQTIGDGGGSNVRPNGARPGSISSEAATKANSEATKPDIKAATRSDSVYRYPANPPIDEDTDYVMFNFYKYIPPFGKAQENSGSGYADYNKVETQYNKTSFPSILLYMPEDISTGYKGNWTGKNISNIGKGVLQSVGEGNNFGDTFKSFAEETVNAIERLPMIAGASAVSAAIGKITGESLSLDDIFSSTRGVILNPNTELLFTGLDLRNFSLTYKLVPRNAKEADNIEGIIRTFKKAMLPSWSNVEDTGIFNSGITFDIPGNNTDYRSGFIAVPDLVKVDFMTGGSLNPHVPQYKMCALTQVDINYTPDGTYSTLRDGRMVAYSLTLSFQETRLIFREDIREGVSY
jgi:hypothetical protein